jgi:hypothetical protein
MIMLYILYKNGLRWEDLYRLQQHAGLSRESIEGIENLALLNARVTKVKSCMWIIGVDID